MRGINKQVKTAARMPARLCRAWFHAVKRRPYGGGLVSTAAVLVVIAVGCAVFGPRGSYDLGESRALLPDTNASLAKAIAFDATKRAYTYDSSVTKTASTTSTNGVGGVSLVAPLDAAKGVTVSDSTAGVTLKMAPHFELFPARRQDNRVIYPMKDGTGWAVYTLSKSGVKEDIVLTSSVQSKRIFSFDLSLGDTMQARIEPDGSVGVYGNSLLSGTVTTATATDSALLQKARENAPKTTLMFRIPKPVIFEKNNKQSEASAVYALRGNTLDVIVNDLSHANFPVTIDPSIYVVTAQQFMEGNNETNINFDIANKLIDKTPTTGARFNSWNTTTNLPSPTWGGGTVATGGFIYNVGGTAMNGQIYNTQGASSLTIPTGVTSITIKAWGAGGGSGGSSASSTGGTGGGGGFVSATFAVTPGETLDTYVGGGGTGGVINTAGGGGGGGGYTSLYRGSTPLLIAPGGGGGGGANGSTTGGNAGAGGSGSGNGVSSGSAGGGNPGTSSAGGNGGTGGNNAGSAGTSLNGGDGGDGRTATGADGSGAAGGLATGGNGGSVVSTARAGGGGGGSGYFGGGGGSGSLNNTGGGGGGGGYYYFDGGATSTSVFTGNQSVPGGSGDANRGGAGQGATAASLATAGNKGVNGVLYITFNSGGSTTTQSVAWAQFDASSGVLNSADPGSGSCGGWCTTSAYNLPAARKNFSLVAYNGFLYVLGGQDQSGNDQKSVYIAKLGANGEPQLWHPTNTDKSSWTYWYRDTDLTTTQNVFSAVAYNNRIYIVGGRNGSNFNASVALANINPTGTLGSFSTTTALPSALANGDVQVFNDRIYFFGGQTSSSATPQTTVYYSKINSDGTLNAWNATSNFTGGRVTQGGTMTAIWGAYVYLSGGCTAVTGNGYCTTVASDTQIASINADGSLDAWGTIGGVSNAVTGSNLVSWRNNIYAIGGCMSQNTGGTCDTTSSAILYGTINEEGDASTVAQSVASNSGTCSGSAPTNCNLPGATYVGNMLNAAVITNGNLYVIGGCTNNACSATSGNVIYASISSSGALTKPSTCPSGTYQGSQWCVDTTNTVTGGIAASSPVVFNNRIYLVGGLNGTQNVNAIYRTTVNADGSIGAWTSQTMTGVGATNVSYEYAYARANPSSAGTSPGNLFIFGGCTTSDAAGCTAYSGATYKCNIQTAGAIAGCSTTNQLQIGTIPGNTQAGLAIMSGTVYANYVYLIGGVSPAVQDLPTVRYAKFDNNNNVVTAGTSGWTEASNQMNTGRRRAAAFGYNGYLYAVGGYDGTSGSVLADIEFIKINTSDGSLGSATEGFKVSSVRINQRWGLSVPVSNSFAYVVGGCIAGASPSGCTSRTDVVQTFQIYNNNDGAPAGYSSATSLTAAPNRFGVSATILNGYIYAAGGCTSTTDCTNAISDVSYASINANGTLGNWATTSNALPAVRAWGNLQSAGGSLYYIGGQSSTATDYRTEVYYVTPSTNGNITTAWNTASNGLPAARTQFGATVWNNRLYVVGGKAATASCSTGVCNTVFVSPQLGSGGNITSAWSTASTSFTIPRSGLTAVAYANNLYLLGGYDGTNVLSDTQYSQINASTGNVGSWTYSESLPNPVMNADGFAANGYIYLIGGRSATSTCTSSSFVAPISANTTIDSGNKPTGIGTWFSTNQRYTGDRYGNAAAYADGRAYVVGGMCNGTFPSTPNQQTSLLSQPQVAKYSISFDTDTDVYPSKWLVNGVDNSTGANWQMKYRSMTNTTTSCTGTAMTTWGLETNFGNVVLGTPYTYTPKDASGNNTNCARFYYMNLTVDSSQAFGYPDDVSRGPTISDITLQFTADPSKRLSHGRTFTGGVQQPLDTPIYSQ